MGKVHEMTWTPETNRIPWFLLTEEEKTALEACKHEVYAFSMVKGWRSFLRWDPYVIYRAKPAPKRLVTWHNVYSGGVSNSHESRDEADRLAQSRRLCVYRMSRLEDGSDPQIDEVEEV